MNQKRAHVTLLLLWSNILVFLAIQFLVLPGGRNALEEFTMRWGLVPSRFMDGAFWQPLSTMFVHFHPLHLFANMLALWSLGTPIEKTIGSNRFAWLYFVSGATGSLFVILWALIFQDDTLFTPTIGASGAVLGILGALAVFYPNSRLLVFFFPMKARTAAIGFGLISILLAVSNLIPGISHMGHLGGLVGGVLYSRLALGIDFFSNNLHSPSEGFFSGRRGGGNFSGSSGASQSGDPMADLLQRLQDLERQSRGESSPSSEQGPSGRNEKIINPFPEDYKKEESSEEKPPPSEGKRLYYDPTTGKFYLK